MAKEAEQNNSGDVVAVTLAEKNYELAQELLRLSKEFCSSAESWGSADSLNAASHAARASVELQQQAARGGYTPE